jgi:hypothetical protein
VAYFSSSGIFLEQASVRNEEVYIGARRKEYPTYNKKK